LTSETRASLLAASLCCIHGFGALVNRLQRHSRDDVHGVDATQRCRCGQGGVTSGPGTSLPSAHPRGVLLLIAYSCRWLLQIAALLGASDSVVLVQDMQLVTNAALIERLQVCLSCTALCLTTPSPLLCSSRLSLCCSAGRCEYCRPSCWSRLRSSAET
jgi:hypothetical protein